MKYTQQVNADNDGVVQIAESTRTLLEKYGVEKKELLKTVLAVEEAAGGLTAHAFKGSVISARYRFFMGVVTIELSAEGEAFGITDAMQTDILLADDVEGDAQDMIRGILLKSVAEDLKYHHRNGVNRIRLTIHRSPRAFLYQTLGAMAMAIPLGLMLTMLGNDALNGDLDAYFFSPVKTMYINALKMIVAPVVFFSIASCIVQFSNLTELGRVGGKIIILYVMTTIIAVMVGLGMYYLFKPGSMMPAAGDAAAVGSVASQTMNVSIKEKIRLLASCRRTSFSRFWNPICSN